MFSSDHDKNKKGGTVRGLLTTLVTAKLTILHNKHRTAHTIYGMNLPSACPRVVNIGGIRVAENKS